VLTLNTVHCGDCLDLMREIPDKSIDMILCDLPYGTTQNKWDTIIPLDQLWAQYKRIRKPNAAIVLTAQTPFDKVLGVSNLAELKYEWIWRKERGTGFLNAKKMPLKVCTNILVFYKKLAVYNPQMVKLAISYKHKLPMRASTNYGVMNSHNTKAIYKEYTHSYPTNLIDLPSVYSTHGKHPTQKPVALFEYLIKTYTNEGATVLDNCAGSGTTGVACINLKRNYILIEQDKGYCAIAEQRIQEATC